ncbi:MAG: futalosine hydrolase [Myxococcota bacterium]
MILIVSAVREELGNLPGHPVGVGAVQAAVAATLIIREHAPDGVVMMGTAGAYPGGPRVGEAVVAYRVGQAQGLSVMGLGYTPRAPAPIPADPRLMARFDVPRVGVLSVDAISTDATLARRLADDWQVEQLEAFGVAYACAAAGVPFTMVFGITHRVGPEAHTHWLTNRVIARRAARIAVSDGIGG